MAKRLTRQDIKRDEVLEGLELAVHYLQHHGRQILAGVGAAAALLLAGVGWSFWRDARSLAAAERLAEAVQVYGAPLAGETAAGGAGPTFPDAAARAARAKELFGSIAAGTGPAAGVARLYLGKIAAAEGRSDEARRHWQAFVDEEGDHALAAAARVNLLELDLQEGKASEVEAALRAMLDDPDRPLPEDLLLHELGRALEALDRGDEAADLYQRIAEEFPGSPYAAEAERRGGAGTRPGAIG